MQKNIFEEIQSQISITDVISPILTLKKKGNEFITLCPFHEEKSESFFINNAKGLFFCFGCKAKGNMFHFISQYYNIPLFDAAKKISEQFNIKLNLEYQTEKVNQNIFHIMHEIYKFFLAQNTNIEYQNFIKKRQIIQKLGYSAYDKSLYQYAIEKNINIKILQTVGLLTINNQNVFFNRIIFPIINYKNQIVAFGGRGINQNILPKYLHSKESSIFYKKYILYGENIALKNTHSQIFVVEGYIDCIKMQEKGFLNTVAALGTSLTIYHINKLWKYTKEIVMFFDGDIAGKKALKKTIELIIPYLEMGYKEISAIILTENIDPDEFINKYNINNINQYKVFIEEIIWQLFMVQDSEISIRRSEAEIEKLLKPIQSFNLKKKISYYINKKLYTKNTSIKPLIQNHYTYNNIELQILILLAEFDQYIDNKIEILNHITFSSNYFQQIKQSLLENKKVPFLQEEAKKILELNKLSSQYQVLTYLKIMMIKLDLSQNHLSYLEKIELNKEMNILLANFNK